MNDPSSDQPRLDRPTLSLFVASRALVPITGSVLTWILKGKEKGERGSISGEQRSNETWPIQLLLTVISCYESWWWWWRREEGGGGGDGKGMDRSKGVDSARVLILRVPFTF